MSAGERFENFLTSVLRSMLFLSSYAPLIVILAVLLWSTGPRFERQLPLLSLSFSLPLWSTGLAVVGILSIFVLYLFLRSLKKAQTTRIEVEEIQQRDEEIVSYLVTYALPFLAAPFEDKEKAIGLGIFFVVVWLLQIKLNLLHINPVLAAVNYHVYEVKINGTVQILLSKKRRGPANIIYAAKMGDNILFEGDQ